MTPQDLLTILPRGPEFGTDVRTLAYRLGTDEREIREGLRELVVTHKKPVNTKGGVYLARNPDELEPTLADYWCRFLSLKERMDALGLASYEDNPQLQLPV